MKYGVLLGVGLLSVTAVAQPRRWIRANFHAHSVSGALGDDGSETPAALHRAMRERGFDFSLHTVHSTLNLSVDAPAAFAEESVREETLGGVLGEELTVAPGPRFQRKTRVLGRDAPGNLDHLSIFGMKSLVPSGTPLARACALVHADGGVCIVNHPGPGPMMWEDGLWEAPPNRHAIDALEVYNGQAISAIGLDFEARYREATAYGGLALKIRRGDRRRYARPAVSRARAGASVVAGRGQAARAHDAPLADAAARSRRGHAGERRLGACARRDRDAVKAQRTIATYTMDVRVSLDGLGEVRHTGDVALALDLSRRVAEVTLYREGEAVQSWRDVKHVTFHETITAPAAYVFAARDGAGRLLTSAIWYEPPSR